MRSKHQQSDTTAPEVVIYTTVFCGYCMLAARLIQNKGVPVTKINVSGRADRRREMEERSGGRSSTPQIFIDGEHIGGADDLMRLDRAGALDPKLGLA